MEKLNKEMKGITLISLIITIILLLILSGIVLGQLTQNKFFEKARIAKNKIKNEQELENEILLDYENQINNLENYIDYTKLKVGDYINYPVYYDNVMSIENPTSTPTLQNGYIPKDEYNGWRILSIDTENEIVKLVSAGIPINYYHQNVNEISIPNLTSKFFSTLINSSIQTYYNFYKCGFKTSKYGTTITNINDLKTLFNNDFTEKYKDGETYTDDGKTYEYVLGNPKVRSITKEDIDKVLGKTSSEETQITMETNKDLLAIPCKDFPSNYAMFWFATTGKSNAQLYALDYNAGISQYACNGVGGLRIVITLKPNIKFIKAEENINDTQTWNISI